MGLPKSIGIWPLCRALGRRLFAAILLCGLIAGQAMACQLPRDLQQLAYQMAAATTQNASADGGRTSALLAGMSEIALMRQLSQDGLTDLQPLALDLLAEAEQFASHGFVQRPSKVQGLLSQLDSALLSACEADAQQNDTWFEALAAFGGAGDGDGLSSQLGQNSTVQATALLTALAGFIAALYGIDFAYRQVMALIYNRKMCLIPAQIDTGSTMVAGHVTTLGRGGFRFTAGVEDGADALVRAVAVPQVELDIGGLRFAARPSTLVEDHADFKLEESLSLSNQKLLLSASVISPYYVRKRRKTAKLMNGSDSGSDSDAAAKAAIPPRP